MVLADLQHACSRLEGSRQRSTSVHVPRLPEDSDGLSQHADVFRIPSSQNPFQQPFNSSGQIGGYFEVCSERRGNGRGKTFGQSPAGSGFASHLGSGFMGEEVLCHGPEHAMAGRRINSGLWLVP